MGEEERRGEGFDEMERTSGKLYMKFALFCERMIDSGYVSFDWWGVVVILTFFVLQRG